MIALGLLGIMVAAFSQMAANNVQMSGMLERKSELVEVRDQLRTMVHCRVASCQQAASEVPPRIGQWALEASCSGNGLLVRVLRTRANGEPAIDPKTGKPSEWTPLSQLDEGYMCRHFGGSSWTRDDKLDIASNASGQPVQRSSAIEQKRSAAKAARQQKDRSREQLRAAERAKAACRDAFCRVMSDITIVTLNADIDQQDLNANTYDAVASCYQSNADCQPIFDWHARRSKEKARAVALELERLREQLKGGR